MVEFLVIANFTLFLAGLWALTSIVVRPRSWMDVLETTLCTAIVGCVVLYATIFVLSTFKQLAAAPLWIIWIALTVVTLAGAWILRARVTVPGPRILANAFKQSDWFERGLAMAILALLSAAFLMACLSAPLNVDSQIYHLTRQIYWIGDRSAFLTNAHFGHLVQMPPFAEYIGVTLLLMSGHDHLLNLIQFVFSILTIGGILWTARLLRLPRAIALTAALLFLSYPPAFLETSNTKNDIVLSFFLTFACGLLIQAVTRRELQPRAAALMLTAAGLAMLTKGTALPWLAAIAIGMLFALVRFRIRVRWLAVIMGLLIFVAIAVPHYVRAWPQIQQTDGTGTTLHRNQHVSIAGTMSVLLRLVANQLASPIIPLNRVLRDVAENGANALGVPVDDPGTTMAGSPFAVAFTPDNEDTVGGPVQVLAVFAAIVAIVFAMILRRPTPGGTILLGLLALTGLVFYCALFRWQIWGGRLLIPAVAMLSVPTAFGLALIPLRIGLICASILALALASYSLAPWSRPLFGKRSVLHFDRDVRRTNDVICADAALLFEPFLASLKPRSVCLETGPLSSYEFLRTIRDASGAWPKIIRADQLATIPFLQLPEVLIATGSRIPPQSFTRVVLTSDYTLWVRSDLVASIPPTVRPPLYSEVTHSLPPFAVHWVEDGRIKWGLKPPAKGLELPLPGDQPARITATAERHGADSTIEFRVAGRTVAKLPLTKNNPRASITFVVPANADARRMLVVNSSANLNSSPSLTLLQIFPQP